MHLQVQHLLEQFEQLQKRYLGSVPSKLDKLDSAWQAITAGDWSKPAVDQLKQEVHRIAGSSGSYGFHALSEAAIDLENELLRWYQNPDDAALRHSIEQGHTKFVAKLEQLAQAGARDISAHPVLSGSRQKNKGLVFLVDEHGLEQVMAFPGTRRRQGLGQPGKRCRTVRHVLAERVIECPKGVFTGFRLFKNVVDFTFSHEKPSIGLTVLRAVVYD